MARWLVTTSAWAHFIFPFLKEQTEEEKARSCVMLWLKPCILRSWEFATRQTRHPWTTLLLSPFPVISSCSSVAPPELEGTAEEALMKRCPCSMHHALTTPVTPCCFPFSLFFDILPSPSCAIFFSCNHFDPIQYYPTESWNIFYLKANVFNLKFYDKNIYSIWELNIILNFHII